MSISCILRHTYLISIEITGNFDNGATPPILLDALAERFAFVIRLRRAHGQQESCYRRPQQPRQAKCNPQCVLHGDPSTTAQDVFGWALRFLLLTTWRLLPCAFRSSFVSCFFFSFLSLGGGVVTVHFLLFIYVFIHYFYLCSIIIILCYYYYFIIICWHCFKHWSVRKNHFSITLNLELNSFINGFSFYGVAEALHQVKKKTPLILLTQNQWHHTGQVLDEIWRRQYELTKYLCPSWSSCHMTKFQSSDVEIHRKSEALLLCEVQ